MKKVLFSTLLGLALLSLIGCSKDKKDETETEPEATVEMKCEAGKCGEGKCGDQ